MEVSWMTDPGQWWAQPPLHIDQPAPEDQEIRVLARTNRLAIKCEAAVRKRSGTPGTDIIDFPLRCVAHPHPECRFRWVQVTLDLKGTAGASITDLSPRDEISEHPVKISTTYKGGVKFDIAMLPVHPELSAEHSTEQDVYFPKISVSGVGFSFAMWDFTAIGDEPLKVDRQLRLLATVPSSAAEIPASITVKASVAARGLPGRIPLVGRQNKTIPLKHRA
jgi:hypothetical protein